jgi:hypothetical protein
MFGNVRETSTDPDPHNRAHTPSKIMLPLALKANISTEVTVETSVMDRVKSIRTLVHIGLSMTPKLTTNVELFEFLFNENANGIFKTQVCFEVFKILFVSPRKAQIICECMF